LQSEDLQLKIKKGYGCQPLFVKAQFGSDSFCAL